jgi:hypothetical protein
MLVLVQACAQKEDGGIEGSVVPAQPGVRATASAEGRQVAAADADPATGTFRMTVPPGSYDVAVTVPSAPFPAVFPGIVVRSREVSKIGPVSLPAPAVGNGAITGIVRGASGDVRVALLEEGTERASLSADLQGRYEFENVLPGNYTVQVLAPGFARDVRPVAVSDGSRSARDFRLLYVTALDGVDWEKGTIRVRGIGLPPLKAPTPTVRKEMAKRAALADAERNLLRVIGMIQTGPDENLTEFLGEKTFLQSVQGFVKGYRIAAERELDGGRLEIELELALTGPDGLTSYLGSR